MEHSLDEGKPHAEDSNDGWLVKRENVQCSQQPTKKTVNDSSKQAGPSSEDK